MDLLRRRRRRRLDHLAEENPGRHARVVTSRLFRPKDAGLLLDPLDLWVPSGQGPRRLRPSLVLRACPLCPSALD